MSAQTNHYRFDNRRKKGLTTAKVYFENKKMLIKTLMAGNLLCFYKCICQWWDSEHLVFTPRRSEETKDIDLDP